MMDKFTPNQRMALIGGGAFLLWRIFKSPPPENKTDQTVQKELAELQGEIPPSYTDAQYRFAADAIATAMADQGTDEETIYRYFSMMKNDTDFLKLVVAFGIRPKYEFAISVGNWNLAQWLQDELNDSELAHLNSILKGKGIKFRV